MFTCVFLKHIIDVEMADISRWLPADLIPAIGGLSTL